MMIVYNKYFYYIRVFRETEPADICVYIISLFFKVSICRERFVIKNWFT